MVGDQHLQLGSVNNASVVVCDQHLRLRGVNLISTRLVGLEHVGVVVGDQDLQFKKRQCALVRVKKNENG